MKLNNAFVLSADGRWEKRDLNIRDGIFSDERSSGGEAIDLSGRYVVPGLVDVHTHGISGGDFLTADRKKLEEMSLAYARHGVTSVMPTLASGTFDEMCARTKLFGGGIKTSGAAFCGVHWEGRYLNPKRKGAHAPELLAPLSGEDLDRIPIDPARTPWHISAAYELDRDGSFARKAVGLGATLGLGHTDATYEEAVIAEKNGVTSYTHLFNCMPPVHHRAGGAVTAALTGNAFAELICDGIHLAPETVRLAWKMLGKERLVLITDSMEATDFPDGNYSIAGNPCIVKDGIARTPEGNLAGSTLTLDRAVRNLIRFTGATPEEAILCATRNPAREMKLAAGEIRVGLPADFLVLADPAEFSVERVFCAGKEVIRD